MKFKDITGDGVVDNADRGPTGSPHPNLTLGFNIGLDYKQFDFTMFLYGSFGNEIFNYNKIFHDFRLFNTNVTTDLLTDSGHLKIRVLQSLVWMLLIRTAAYQAITM